MDRVTNLKQALPYIQKHRGKTFVIKLGGRIFKNAEALKSLAEDLTLLHNVGINIVVVHGGGPQMNELADRLGVPQTVVAGRRVTDSETLDMAKMMFRGKLNTDLVSALRQCGTLAVGLSGGDGGLVEARRRPVVDIKDDTGATQTVDFGHVGDIEAIHPALLTTLAAGGFVPVVCSLASSTSGEILNVNADTMAERIAVALKADKLFLMTDTHGLLETPSDPATLVSYCDRHDLEAMMTSGAISGGMKPKITSALRALAGGVNKVHIVSAFSPSSLLLEVFTNEGCGTLVVADKSEVRL